MKVAFVLGFYNPVEVVLQSRFPAEFNCGNLIWIGRLSKNYPFDLKRFKGRFLSVLDDATKDDVLVLIPKLRDYDWAEASVRAILEQTRDYPHKGVELLTLPDAQNSDQVVAELNRFGLKAQASPVLPVAKLQEYLGDSRVLCVRAMWQASFAKSLEHMGVPRELFNDRFNERTVSPGQNSNLIRELKKAASRFDQLLYAWKSLRTLPAKVKKQYKGKVLEAATTAEVVELLVRSCSGMDRPSS